MSAFKVEWMLIRLCAASFNESDNACWLRLHVSRKDQHCACRLAEKSLSAYWVVFSITSGPELASIWTMLGSIARRFLEGGGNSWDPEPSALPLLLPFLLPLPGWPMCLERVGVAP